RNPRCGTTMAEPPVCSMVRVYDTTLPHLSVATRCVVDRPSVDVSGVSAACAVQLVEPGCVGSPGANGLVSVEVGLIRQARVLANCGESRPVVGTGSKAGSATQRLRSENATRLASRYAWSEAVWSAGVSQASFQP